MLQLLFITAFLFMMSYGQTLVPHGTINSLNQGNYVKGAAVPGDTTLQLTFFVAPSNEGALEKYLLETSDPSSPNYGKYLSKTEIDNLLSNVAGQNAINQFLTSILASVVTTQDNGNQITASAPASVWESALDCTFYFYTKQGFPTLIRTPEYSLPDNVSNQVTMVTNTVEFPVSFHHGPIILPSPPRDK